MPMRNLIPVMFFAAVLMALLSVQSGAPWRFSNDDNGAWYTAIARTHLRAGLAATRGQDFFTRRDSGERVPYLHHPPLPGLLLAGAFGLTGRDSPRVARWTFGLMHMLTFLVIAGLARQIWDPRQDAVPFLYALAVIAVVPMSTFYGKMPNHEVPGLLFFAGGVLVWGFNRDGTSTLRQLVALALWSVAVFSSWHAAICIAAWLGVRISPPAFRRRALISLLFVGLVVALVVLHIRWANHGEAVASQAGSLRHWLLAGGGASLTETMGFWRRALGTGMGRYAYLPALLALGWVLLQIVQAWKRKTAWSALDRDLAGMAAGTVIYALLFPRAVNNHAYQGFYLLPFVALSSGCMLHRFCHAAVKERWRGRMVVCAYVFLASTCLLGTVLSVRMYRKSSPGAMRAAADIAGQYE